MLLPRDSIFAFAVAVAACAAPRPRRALTPPVAPETIDPSGEWEVRWDRTFAGWSPIFDGMLVLTHTGPKWNATLAFENSGWKFQFQSLRIDGDHVTLDFTNSDGPVTIDGWIREKRFVGEMRSKTIDWTPFAGHRVEYPKLVFAHANQSLPTL